MAIDSARIQALQDPAELVARVRPIDLGRLRQRRVPAMPRVANATPIRRVMARDESASVEGSPQAEGSNTSAARTSTTAVTGPDEVA